MLQIYRIILEYSSNIYIFLDVFQLSTLFYSIILKLLTRKQGKGYKTNKFPHMLFREHITCEDNNTSIRLHGHDFFLAVFSFTGILIQFSSLQQSFMLFLILSMRPTPPRPKEVAAELPDSLEYAFDCHRVKMSSGPNGSYFPFLNSIRTLPDSSARTVCHCPAGTLIATLGLPGDNSMDSVQMRSNSS